MRNELLPSEQKERLTLSQAIVKYLQAQYSAYDGVEQRFIQGNLGNLWAWECVRVEPGTCGVWSRITYHKPCNEQFMVHASTGFARAKRRKATMASTTSIGPEQPIT